jgi:predicted Zn finger-like uncharacterized protein
MLLEMFIACPKCATTFTVLPEQIGPNGRKVKCSKCGNIWHQRLEEHIRIEPVLNSPVVSTKPMPIGNGVNLPALLPIKIQPYLYTMPFVMLALIFSLSIVLFPDFFGVHSLIKSRELSIEDVRIENRKESNKVIVSYKIMNSSRHNVSMPLVRVRLLDENNSILKHHISDQTNKTLAPSQYVTIKTEFNSPPTSSKYVDVTLGNKLDFLLR